MPEAPKSDHISMADSITGQSLTFFIINLLQRMSYKQISANKKPDKTLLAAGLPYQKSDLGSKALRRRFSSGLPKYLLNC